MKAKDIKIGMVLYGWTVTDVIKNCEASFWYGDETDGDYTTEIVVLLKLETTWHFDGYDVNGEEIWRGGQPPVEQVYPVYDGEPTKTETRRDWYLEDEEVAL